MNGTAKYTGNFTPSYEPITPTANTKLLIHGNSIADASTSEHIIATNGNVAVSTGGNSHVDDSSTNSNKGAISGATTTASVYGGNAPKLPRSIDIATETFGDAIGLGSYQFNGSSDYVSCGNDTSITSAVSNLSVCCWFKGMMILIEYSIWLSTLIN
jgi:hypothetical protein